jgi:hypothetical protein
MGHAGRGTRGRGSGRSRTAEGVHHCWHLWLRLRFCPVGRGSPERDTRYRSNPAGAVLVISDIWRCDGREILLPLMSMTARCASATNSVAPGTSSVISASPDLTHGSRSQLAATRRTQQCMSRERFGRAGDTAPCDAPVPGFSPDQANGLQPPSRRVRHRRSHAKRSVYGTGEASTRCDRICKLLGCYRMPGLTTASMSSTWK